MAVYVDDGRYPFRGMVMCHMLADTPAELHAMAARIGVARQWYQGFSSTPHYDVCRAKRKLAVKLGAVQIERAELVKLIHAIRAGGLPWS